MASEAVIRPAGRGDLPELVSIYNHYVANSCATFDTEPVTVESRVGWLEKFSEVGPYRLLAASVALHRKFGFTEVGVFEEYAVKDGRYVSSLWDAASPLRVGSSGADGANAHGAGGRAWAGRGQIGPLRFRTVDGDVGTAWSPC